MQTATLMLMSALSASPTCGAQGVAFQPASAQAHLMVLEGRIDRLGPVSVVFDTGGTAPFDVFVSPSVATRLNLSLSEEIAPPDTTAVGSARQTYRTATLDDFELGPIALTRTPVAVVPMIDAMQAQVGRRIDAIVGHHLVQDRIIAIDYAERRIDFAAQAGPETEALPFTLAARKPLALVSVTVNGQGPFVLEIDTGATGTTLSPEAARRAGVASQGQGRLGGAGGNVDVGLGEADLTLGPVSRHVRVAISPAVSAISASAGSPMDGILGGDFFAGACLTIDYPGKRLWVKTP